MEAERNCYLKKKRKKNEKRKKKRNIVLCREDLY